MKPNLSRAGLLVLAAVPLMILSEGCYVTATPEPVGYAEVSSVPVDYEVRPHTTYEGRQVYWINGRWGYQERGRWAYYHREPEYLGRYRGQHQHEWRREHR